MYILLVYTVKICQKIYHFIISRTKVEKRKPPLKLNIIIKECSSNIKVGSVGRYVPGVWLVLVLKSQTEEARTGVIRGRLSLVGSLVLTCIVSQSWDRKWTVLTNGPLASCALLLPLCEVEVRRQGLLAKPWSPTLGSEPQLHWGQPPWHVWLGSKGWRWMRPENPVLRVARPHLASDSAALQRNCAPDKCTSVSNASNSLAGPRKAQSDVTKRWTHLHEHLTYTRKRLRHWGSLQALSTSDATTPGSCLGSELFVGFWFLKIKIDLRDISIDSDNSHQKFCNLFK